MWSQKITIIPKNSGIALGVFIQLSFSGFEKIQNYDVTSRSHYSAFFGGNYDKLKESENYLSSLLEVLTQLLYVDLEFLWENHKYRSLIR